MYILWEPVRKVLGTIIVTEKLLQYHVHYTSIE